MLLALKKRGTVMPSSCQKLWQHRSSASHSMLGLAYTKKCKYLIVSEAEAVGWRVWRAFCCRATRRLAVKKNTVTKIISFFNTHQALLCQLFTVNSIYVLNVVSIEKNHQGMEPNEEFFHQNNHLKS